MSLLISAAVAQAQKYSEEGTDTNALLLLFIEVFISKWQLKALRWIENIYLCPYSKRILRESTEMQTVFILECPI